MYDAETIMIKQKIQINKHWTFKITKWEQRDFFFQHNTFQGTTGSDLHHVTSWFFFFSLYAFVFFFLLSSMGTTAPCTPSIFAWYLVLVFHLKLLLINRVSLISTDWVSKENCIILRFVSLLWLLDVAFFLFCCCFTGGFEGLCAASLECRIVHGSPVWEQR